jgi:monoamine oxidase
VKVVIVGAGLAGLTGAVHLTAAGHDVVVVEGRDEVGGRSRSRPVGGDVVELGASSFPETISACVSSSTRLDCTSSWIATPRA